MSRTKGSKNKTTELANKIKSKAQIRDEKYKFDVGDIVFYMGKTYEFLRGLEGIIIRRSTPKGKCYYKVKFIVDGIEKEYSIHEPILKGKYEQIELKEKNDENN